MQNETEMNNASPFIETPLLFRLKIDNWEEILPYLNYEDMISLTLTAKYLRNLCNSIWFNQKIMLAILRSKIQNYFQCTIPFEKFPMNNEHVNTNYKDTYCALSNFIRNRDSYYNASLIKIDNQSFPEAEFVSMLLYIMAYSSKDENICLSFVQNFKKAEKFYKHSPNRLTAFVLADYLKLLGFEYFHSSYFQERINAFRKFFPRRDPSTPKQIDKNSDDFLYRAVQQLSNDTFFLYQHNQLSTNAIRFSNDYFEQIKNLILKAFDGFGLSTHHSNLNQELQKQYIATFSGLRSYQLLLQIQKYGLQQQAFDLTPVEYTDFNLNIATWLFDIYQSETIRTLSKVKEEPLRLRSMKCVIHDKYTKTIMEKDNVALHLKYKIFMASVGLLEHSFKEQHCRFPIHLKALRKDFSLDQALDLMIFYSKNSSFIKYAKNTEANNLILSYLKQDNCNSDLKDLMKLLDKNTANDYTYVKLTKPINLRDKTSVVNLVKIKNLKRKQSETIKAPEDSVKKSKNEEASTADYQKK